ncbi:hypothetical protein I551_5200 [Mycobacterium ulcerans str. Harvey]|uniref:Uncharacterized protein n=1 Tax=Mycobacterium ulcerans str. Harvey TaxID=1299332 RepID=A0ABN0QUA2_MYCUL|nr:hypothetical protein I551_5200 [Mycobacterium ulcerans str. Harvey]
MHHRVGGLLKTLPAGADLVGHTEVGVSRGNCPAAVAPTSG